MFSVSVAHYSALRLKILTETFLEDMGAEVVSVMVTFRVFALVYAIKLRIKCSMEEDQPVTVTGHCGPVKTGTAAGNVTV